MGLGGRAALSVPLIALLIGVVTALFSVAFEGNNALIKGWSLARITFGYAVIIALPIGVALSFPAVLFGHFLLHPRRVWLISVIKIPVLDGIVISGLWYSKVFKE